jgi:hypothetical protein
MPPHDPTIDLPLTRRDVDAFLPARKIYSPRPVVPLHVRIISGSQIKSFSLRFIVDTGADVTMIPERDARRYRIVGYDPAAVSVETGTSFHGQLRGKWGHVHTTIGSRQLQLPCFYYADILPASGWFLRWLSRWLRNQAGDGPFILGRAGLFPLTSLLVGRGRVCLSDQPFR